MDEHTSHFVAPVDTAQAAILSGYAEKTLENLRSTGGGPPFLKIGRLVRYDPRDIEAWKAERRINSTSEAA